MDVMRSRGDPRWDVHPTGCRAASRPAVEPLRILLWHQHGSWTTSFVQGPHTYLVPAVADRGPDGRGRAETWLWPDSVIEVTPEDLRSTQVDVVVLQDPRHEELCTAWLGRRPGVDVPAVWVEHNAPQGRINDMHHPVANRPEIVVVHVTPTNALFWDCGSTPTRVIEHGVVDPGYRYTGELPRAAVVVNDPERRDRVVGADLLPTFQRAAPLDLFGMRTHHLARVLAAGGAEDISQAMLHDELARRRVYLHPIRWTSLGLSLLEAMMLGMPVVALATTEVPAAVPAGAGVVTNDIGEACRALKWFVDEPGAAANAGAIARKHTLERYGLERFLWDWNDLLAEVVAA